MAEFQKYPEFDGTQLCAQVGISFYYYEDDEGPKTADTSHLSALRDMCKNCTFLNECATWAIHHERYGFWAGMTEEERVSYRKKQNIKLLLPEVRAREA